MTKAGALLTDRDIVEQLRLRTDLSITNYSDESITPVGYDIRAGEFAFSLRRNRSYTLLNKLEIPPGDTVFIESYESCEFSKNIGGLTLCRLSLKLDGLDATALTVDPSFNGNLLIILTNHGRRPVTIEKCQRLMTLCLFWVSSPAEKPLERPKQFREDIKEEFRKMETGAQEQFWKRVARYAVLSVLLLALFLGLAYKKVMNYSEASTWWVAVTAFYASVIERWF